MPDTFSPLWSAIVESSIWAESDETRIVFITMLARKDSDHVYRGNAYRLGRLAFPNDDGLKAEKKALEALKVLSSPDRGRSEPQPHEGRRIQKAEDGWLILNGEVYREKMREEMKKARNRRSQRNWRDKLAKKKAAIQAAKDNKVAREEMIEGREELREEMKDL